MPTGKHLGVFLGFDPREAAAFAVARQSIKQWNKHMPVQGLVLSELQAKGLYWRETERRLGQLWDVISDAPMSTEFAISRFLVPAIVKKQNLNFHPYNGWALFADSDILVRDNLSHLKSILDDTKAVFCVKHNHTPTYSEKMDGQIQTQYARKNWSSVMAFNVDHPSNNHLTPEMVNTLPGRDLHRFCWLDDDEIGELPPEWNYLVGHTSGVSDPKIVHMTDGIPIFHGFRNIEYANEWFEELDRWAK
jgi:hypothetical protein